MYATKGTIIRLPHCPPNQFEKTGDGMNAGYDIRAAEDTIIYPSYLAKQDKGLNLIEWKSIGKLTDLSPTLQTQLSSVFDLELEDDTVGIKIDSNGEVYQLYYKPQLVKTGLVISYDILSWSLLTTRSSVGGKQQLSMPHGVGIIDFTYKGLADEILISFTSNDVRVIQKGERIAQLIPMNQYKIEIIEGNFEDDSYGLIKNRGGFGSTGSN